MNEKAVCCSAYNTGLFNAMLDMGDVQGVFCGHDHNNDFAGMLLKIFFVIPRCVQRSNAGLWKKIWPRVVWP
jgi:hypothetical protein